MKKMNILFILITTILIFGTTNVFAFDYNFKVVSSSKVYNDKKNIVITNQDNNITNSSGYYESTMTINFDNNYTNSQNHDFMRFNISNIIWSVYENYNSPTQTIEPQDYVMRFNLIGSGNNNRCELEGSYIICPISDNITYSSLNINYLRTQNFNSNIEAHFYINNYVEILDNLNKNNTNEIINNQNQNTETIVNNITTPTIDTNTTNTDSLISIPNSNGKNVVLDLLMTPVTFVTNVINSFSNSCVSYNLGNLMGTDIILPCLNLQNLFGSTVYTVIDCIFTFGMLFVFIRSVKRFIHKSLLLANDVNSEVSIF